MIIVKLIFINVDYSIGHVWQLKYILIPPNNLLKNVVSVLITVYCNILNTDS